MNLKFTNRNMYASKSRQKTIVRLTRTHKKKLFRVYRTIFDMHLDFSSSPDTPLSIRIFFVSADVRILFHSNFQEYRIKFFKSLVTDFRKILYDRWDGGAAAPKSKSSSVQ